MPEVPPKAMVAVPEDLGKGLHSGMLRRVQGFFVPKEENSSTIDHF